MFGFQQRFPRRAHEFCEEYPGPASAGTPAAPRRSRAALGALVAVLLLMGAVLLGGWLERHGHSPLRLLKPVVRLVVAPPPAVERRPALDRWSRLAAWPAKVEAPCPGAAPGTEVLLLMGQSNAANHAGQRHASAFGRRILNFHEGRCWEAASPLLGASGLGGEPWVALANALLDAKLARQVVLVPAAVGNTDIAQWARGGPLQDMVGATLAALHGQGLRVTRVFWHQGESDFRDRRTTAAQYTARFHELLAHLRRLGVDAPVHVSVATAAEPYLGWQADNAIAQAQRALPAPALGVWPGVDTDALLGPLDRHDGIHFSASGQEKFVRATLELLRAAP